MEALVHRERQRIVVVTKSLMLNVSTMIRRVTRPKIVYLRRRRLLRLMLLLLALMRKAKMNRILKHHLLLRNKNWLLQ